MAFTLVYSGEHYVSDILLGWFYAVVAFALNRAWERWRAARRAAREPDEPAGVIPPAPAPLTAAVERE
jgi:membrane-associated phospholipid phosphatase